MTRKDIEGAILSTLVIQNRQSLKYAIDNIMKLSENSDKRIIQLEGGVKELLEEAEDYGTKRFCRVLLDNSEH